MNEWFNGGIFLTHHLTDAEGNYLTCNESKQKYPEEKLIFVCIEVLLRLSGNTSKE